MSLPVPDGKGLRRNPRVTVVEAATKRTIFLVLNTRWGPFKDVHVRQAMNDAINKKAILVSLLFDLGTVAVSACPPTMFGAIPVQDGGWPYNPVKAEQLLAEAIASQLRNVNVRADLSTMDWPSYVGMVLTPPDRTRVQMIVLGWAWPVLDCDGALSGQFHSAVAHPPTGLGPAFSTEAQQIIRNDAPWVFLWTQKWYVATVKNLEGVCILPIEN